jgi:OOP family OmpA-OmpF porin
MRKLALPSLSLLALVCAGCPGNDLRGRTSGIKDLVRQARANGAYKCAPHELAMAESHLEFAGAELDAGKYFPAKSEVGLAEDNARRALQLSPKEQCNPPPPPPKPKDRDGDGIPDKVDACPDDPEDKDGFEDEDGCPDPDNDKDGIADGDDKCPNEPGPKENAGCPDKDRDGDTVVDRLDKCPDQPGPPDNDGCPKPKFIVVTKEKIELKQKVHFATNKSTIYPDSFAMLTEVAEVLKARPEIKVRVEGHTDSRGSMRRNMKLSQERAESVKTFLVGKGVEPERMEARGFGPTQPIDDNRTSKGRENNRRTEFIITTQ